MAENYLTDTQMRWKEFTGTELDRIVEPRAASLLPRIRASGRKLMMGIIFTRTRDGKWRGDCRAYWKAVRA